MPDWKDLAIVLTGTLDETIMEAPVLSERLLSRYQPILRKIVTRYQIGDLRVEVVAEEEPRHAELWRELDSVRTLPGAERALPLEEVARNFLSTGPHGPGDGPRE
jgi:hypothetical protein